MQLKADGSIYRVQGRLLFARFLYEFPNCIAILVSAILTGSLITWLDFLEAMIDVVSLTFVGFVSRKLKRNLKMEYNYGIEKIESISALMRSSFVVAGLITVTVIAVKEIVAPHKTSEFLFIAVIIKMIDIFFDAVFVKEQRKLKNRSDSSIVQSEYLEILRSLAFDLVALAALAISWIMREHPISWYFTPVVSLFLVVVFVVGAVHHIHEAVVTLTDKAIPQSKQLLILKVLNQFRGEYSRLISVKSHYKGSEIMIDLHLKFEKDTSYAQISHFMERFTREIKKMFTNCEVNLIINS